MPNTEPAIDAGHLARFVADRGRQVGLVQVVPAGCITAGRGGQKLAHLDELCDAGVRLFTDDGDTVADAGLLRRAMEYLAARDGVVVQHCVDAGLAAGGQMHEGEVSSRLGMAGVPSEAEEIAIARDIALVRMTGVRYHAQHVSTAGAVALIAAAKAEGLPVTAEATPHHLYFDHSYVEGADPRYKMMPPLRAQTDVAALREGLESGVIDVVATDHAPHADHEKDHAWEEAPFGVIGLEWAAAVVNTVVGLEAQDFFRVLSTAPARLAGIAGQGEIAVNGPANVVVFDPDAACDTTATVSRSSNSPYLGLELTGVVVHTMYEGRFTVRSGVVADTIGIAG
jgi:dihydroorotase